MTQKPAASQRPPKYGPGDFKKSHGWKLRGKLDVPKERWIIHPGAGRDGDPSPVIAWAGWDHLQQAKALAGDYVEAGTQPGWTPEKLQPLLAGVADLLPWLKPWHFDPEVTSGLGEYFAGFLDEAARKPGTTLEALNRLRRIYAENFQRKGGKAQVFTRRGRFLAKGSRRGRFLVLATKGSVLEGVGSRRGRRRGRFLVLATLSRRGRFLVLATLSFCSRIVPIQQMRQMRLGSHGQPRRNPSQGHRGFPTQAPGDF
ncbi:MAG TPA: hypothetical protein VNN22_18690 [Verrucomicrobiae bacterium]|nr:hypothetical protein [Verrucomicrobiae bacterium]